MIKVMRFENYCQVMEPICGCVIRDELWNGSRFVSQMSVCYSSERLIDWIGWLNRIINYSCLKINLAFIFVFSVCSRSPRRRKVGKQKLESGYERNLPRQQLQFLRLCLCCRIRFRPQTLILRAVSSRPSRMLWLMAFRAPRPSTMPGTNIMWVLGRSIHRSIDWLIDYFLQSQRIICILFCLIFQSIKTTSPSKKFRGTAPKATEHANLQKSQEVSVIWPDISSMPKFSFSPASISASATEQDIPGTAAFKLKYPFTTGFEINHFPEAVRNRITPDMLTRIGRASFAYLALHGVHVPAGQDVPPGERKLYIKVSGASEWSLLQAKTGIHKYCDGSLDPLPNSFTNWAKKLSSLPCLFFLFFYIDVFYWGAQRCFFWPRFFCVVGGFRELH